MHSGRRPDGQKSKSLYNQLLADGLEYPPSGTCRRPFDTKICLIGAFISELLEFLDFPLYKPCECDISVIWKIFFPKIGRKYLSLFVYIYTMELHKVNIFPIFPGFQWLMTTTSCLKIRKEIFPRPREEKKEGTTKNTIYSKLLDTWYFIKTRSFCLFFADWRKVDSMLEPVAVIQREDLSWLFRLNLFPVLLAKFLGPWRRFKKIRSFMQVLFHLMSDRWIVLGRTRI